MDLSGGYVVMCATPELQEDISLENIMLGDYVAIADEAEFTCEKDSLFTIGRLSEFSLGEEDGFEILDDFAIHPPLMVDLKLYKPVDYFFIKLFEQDELQTMILESIEDMSMYKLHLEYNYFYMNEISCKDESHIFDTMEKCWLAFYMWYVLDLAFNGKSWVKVKKV